MGKREETEQQHEDAVHRSIRDRMSQIHFLIRMKLPGARPGISEAVLSALMETADDIRAIVDDKEERTNGKG